MESNGTSFRGLIWGQLLAKVLERSRREDGKHVRARLRANSSSCCTTPMKEGAEDDNAGAMHGVHDPLDFVAAIV